MTQSLSGKRVLLVEDEALIAMLAEEMLADLGCIVHGVAGTVSDALAIAQRGGFDLAVLDVNVARERVFPVADALIAQSIPFAFASGYGEQDIMDGYRDRPMVSKPYSALDLERALTAALA